VGFGTELLILLLLGFLVLGPKQMHAVLGSVARVKTAFDKIAHSFKSDLKAELEVPSQRQNDPPLT
jgi:Sec-independent protein translocase protein TatA